MDLSDDEIVVEDDDDDLSDLYPGKFYTVYHHHRSIELSCSIVDFRRLRASDGKELTTTADAQEDVASGQKRKAQTSQVRAMPMASSCLSSI